MSGKTGRFAWSPENQDINAWFYAQQRYRLATGGRDLDGDLKAGINPAYGLNKIWTSLPGGPEHNNATDSFGSRLQDGLRHPPAVPAAAPVYGPPAPSPAPPAPIAGPSGKASLTVRLAGFPEGTGTAATQSGELWDNTPIIERAMPMTAGR